MITPFSQVITDEHKNQRYSMFAVHSFTCYESESLFSKRTIGFELSFLCPPREAFHY